MKETSTVPHKLQMLVWTRNVFVKHYTPNYKFVDTKCQSWKEA